LPPRLTLLNRNDIDNAPAGLMIWCTDCGTYGEVQVFNGSIWTDIMGNATPVIGDVYGGGKIAYILQPGDPGYIAGEIHGLIDHTDYYYYIEWGCDNINIVGAEGTAIGTGLQNTIDIVNGCTQPQFAAKTCFDLVSEGYSDWYLPSKYELDKLYINRVILNIPEYEYWTSTESGPQKAWTLNFLDGYFNQQPKTFILAKVRPIRSF
jgi:hypothetical protein